MEKGFGKCPDCIWYKVEEGCNVERDSKQCHLNKKPRISCKYRGATRCNHPKVKDTIQFELDKNEDCGECLYRDIERGT